MRIPQSKSVLDGSDFRERKRKEIRNKSGPSKTLLDYRDAWLGTTCAIHETTPLVVWCIITLIFVTNGKDDTRLQGWIRESNIWNAKLILPIQFVKVLSKRLHFIYSINPFKFFFSILGSSLAMFLRCTITRPFVSFRKASILSLQFAL